MSIYKFSIIFSNWILVWTVLYFLNLFPIPSPFYIIVIAIIHNIIFSLKLLYNDKKYVNFIIFWVLIFIIKVIPAYIMGIPNNYDGVYFGLVLFVIYLFYVNYFLEYKKVLEILFFKKLKYGPGVYSIINFFNLS